MTRMMLITLAVTAWGLGERADGARYAAWQVSDQSAAGGITAAPRSTPTKPLVGGEVVIPFVSAACPNCGPPVAQGWLQNTVGAPCLVGGYRAGLFSPCCEYEPNCFDHAWDDYCHYKQLRGYRRQGHADCLRCRPCGRATWSHGLGESLCRAPYWHPHPAIKAKEADKPAPPRDEPRGADTTEEIEASTILAPPQIIEVPLSPAPAPTKDRSAKAAQPPPVAFGKP